MEDDKIRDLFSAFDPGLSSDIRFMDKLQRNIEAVDEVRRQVATNRRRNRIALAAAVLSGFVAGVVLMVLVQMFGDFGWSFDLALPYIGTKIMTLDCETIAWIVSAAISSIIAFNAYELTLAKAHDRST